MFLDLIEECRRLLEADLTKVPTSHLRAVTDVFGKDNSRRTDTLIKALRKKGSGTGDPHMVRQIRATTPRRRAVPPPIPADAKKRKRAVPPPIPADAKPRKKLESKRLLRIKGEAPVVREPSSKWYKKRGVAKKLLPTHR